MHSCVGTPNGTPHFTHRTHHSRTTRGRAIRSAPDAMAAPLPKTLITFDVDGTLIKSVGTHANKFHKDAFAHAFKVVHDIDTNIDVIPHHGSTDQLVVEAVLKHHGVPHDVVWAKMSECTDAMLAYAYGAAVAGFAATGLEILPGVQELLTALAAREDVVVGLVTGNLERIAWIKMKALGVEHLFTKPNIGGFGSDRTDRGELVHIARQRCIEKLGFEVSRAVHVGDTPNDVKAAEHGGAIALAVTTGVFNGEALKDAAEDEGNVVVMDGLSDVNAVLRACGLA
mmetsp:Transcript_9791/g.44586  ORF Transcript_9791/g.44586 Transcript_9791/m.44586 type:complete len:284 (-) Transcript_9791:109-960(-)